MQERTPLGIGRINGALYLVDDSGAVIDEYGPNYADLDLPIIDGLSSAPGEASADAARAMLARRLLDALRVRNMASRVSQIDVSDARNAVVLLDGDPDADAAGRRAFRRAAAVVSRPGARAARAGAGDRLRGPAIRRAGLCEAGARTRPPVQQERQNRHR